MRGNLALLDQSRCVAMTGFGVILMLSACSGSRVDRPSEGIRFSQVTPSQEEMHRLNLENLRSIKACVAAQGFDMPGDLNEVAPPGPSEHLLPEVRAERGFGIAIAKSHVVNIKASKSSGIGYGAAMTRCAATYRSRLQVAGAILELLGPDMEAVTAQAKTTAGYRKYSTMYEGCMSGQGFSGLVDSEATYKAAVVSVDSAETLELRLAVELPIAVADLMCVDKHGALLAKELDAAGREFVKLNENQLVELLRATEQVQ